MEKLTADMAHRGARGAIGFPYTYEFTLPVSSIVLLTVSLLYICSFFLIAYLIPMFLLSNLLGLPGPQLSVCLLLIYSLIILLTIIWWTDAVVAHTLGWAVALLLFYYGWLFPEIQIAEATGAVTFSGSSIQILISFGLMLGLLVTLYLGVQRQRYGVGRVSLFDRTLAMSSAKLISIKLTNGTMGR